MSQIEPLENKVNELIGLFDAFKEINAHIEIQEVFQNILLQMVRIVDAEAATLWVVDDELELIEATAAYGPTASSIQNLKLGKNEGIVGQVIQSGTVHYIEDVTNEPGWAKRIDRASGFVTRSMITVPLIAKGNTIGALQMLNKQDGTCFTADDVKLATTLANHSTLALHNSQMYDDLYTMLMSMIRTLAMTLDKRDPYTAGHSERVATYSLWIGKSLKMDKETLDDLYKAALLHDIGKIGIPDDILRKTTKLTDDEFATIKKHPAIGAEILSSMEPRRTMKNSITTARWHHERLNGSGYPDKLTDKDIPLFAKIVGVADSYDAMTTVRPYSNGYSFKEGALELERCKGTLYDSTIVDLFISVLEAYDYQISEKLEGVQLNESI
ncbi:HD domain-containing phosphohydrolase [Virgibacillus flavescens]|uniref:HD domain-containing phosphohydrolase n=1 Tax=Virgibacillus flavescens TaxID=1611422 RepID=UPI003D351FAF